MTLNPNPRWSIAGLRQSFAFLLICSLPFVAVLSGSDLYLHFLPINQLTSERLVLMGLMMRPFAKENMGMIGLRLKSKSTILQCGLPVHLWIS